MTLTSEHIDYIIKDLNYRGIVAEGIQDELIDHICSAVETEMANGTRFIDAYHHTYAFTAEQRMKEIGTNIGIGLYLIAGLVAFLIALATMSFQSFKAAASDPVKSLRSE